MCSLVARTSACGEFTAWNSKSTFSIPQEGHSWTFVLDMVEQFLRCVQITMREKSIARSSNLLLVPKFLFYDYLRLMKWSLEGSSIRFAVLFFALLLPPPVNLRYCGCPPLLPRSLPLFFVLNFFANIVVARRFDSANTRTFIDDGIFFWIDFLVPLWHFFLDECFVVLLSWFGVDIFNLRCCSLTVVSSFFDLTIFRKEWVS